MHIGLIGGIGPVATEVYYRAIVRGFAAAGRTLHLTIAHADLGVMAPNMQAGRAAEQAAVFAGHVAQLKAGGCDAAAVTSMGGHFCIAELEAIAPLPMLNAIPALDAYFASQPARRVGVLGTRTVMESGLYGVRSVEVIAPPPDRIGAVHAAYVALAAAGVATPEQCAFFHDAARRLHHDQGAEIVVLGGTDLSIAFADPPGDVPIVDSALIHADAIVRAALADKDPR
jgi:aspartate racemase